jgi:hypothetical protein
MQDPPRTDFLDGSPTNFRKLTKRKLAQTPALAPGASVNGRPPEDIDEKVGEALAPPTFITYLDR